MQLSVVEQQKPVGREEGQADCAAGQTLPSSDWRVKSEEVGMALVKGARRRRRRSGMCKRAMV
jgi:hypothetical protein